MLNRLKAWQLLAILAILATSTKVTANPIVLSGHTFPVVRVEWSPDGKLLASAGADKTVRIWDIETKKQVAVFHGHTERITELVWSPQGTLLATASGDKSVRIWDLKKEKEVAKKEHASLVQLLAWRPDGKSVASVEHVTLQNKVEKVFVWESTSGKVLREFTDDRIEFRSIAWSPDGKELAVCEEFGKIRILDPEKDEPKLVIDAHKLSANIVAWSPDGKTLASGGSEKKKRAGFLKLWDPSTGKLIRSIQADEWEVSQIRWSPDGKLLAMDSNDDTIRIWSSTTGRLVRSIPVAGFAHLGFEVLWRPDGKAIATSSDGVAQIYDSGSGRAIFVSPLGEHMIRTIAWHPEGKALAAGNDHGDVLVWMQKGK